MSSSSSSSSRDSHSSFGSSVTLASSASASQHADSGCYCSDREGDGSRTDFPTLPDHPAGPRCDFNTISNRSSRGQNQSESLRPDMIYAPIATEAMASDPKLSYLDRVVLEVLQTERMYVRDLRSIVEDYVGCIIDSPELPLEPEEVSIIFGNVEDIYALHRYGNHRKHTIGGNRCLSSSPQEIQIQLNDWEGPPLERYGELVLEGSFHVHRAKHERTLFLFHKILLLVKRRDDGYFYKGHILCSNLMLTLCLGGVMAAAVSFIPQARVLEDKRLWITELKRLIIENHPGTIPLKVRLSTSRKNRGNKYRSRRISRITRESWTYEAGITIALFLYKRGPWCNS
uniref:DH domain-containing protein n=1 Tax=Eptatretus burgeri TaxID=7764 RepID=A0A8C4R6S0_EPTBU